MSKFRDRVRLGGYCVTVECMVEYLVVLVIYVIVSSEARGRIIYNIY